MARKRKKKQRKEDGQVHSEEMKETVPEASAEADVVETPPLEPLLEAEASEAQTEVEAEARPTIEEMKALEQELEAARNEAQQNLEGWQRALADFANYKKRIEREREEVYRQTAGRILKKYLEVLDDLERALKSAPQEGEGAEWAKGIELVHRKLRSILEAEGVRPMEAEGQPFDPNLHEAISHEEAEGYESGQIIEVVQQGYLLGDRVLRPALVRVAR